MKKFLLFAAAVLALAACNKGDDVKPLTLDEAYACLEGQWISDPITIDETQSREILLLRGNKGIALYYNAGWKTGSGFSWMLMSKEDDNYSSGNLLITYGPEDQSKNQYRRLSGGSFDLLLEDGNYVTFTHSPYKTAQEVYDILFNQGKWWFRFTENTVHHGLASTAFFSRVVEFNKKESTMELYTEEGIAEDPATVQKTVFLPATTIQLTADPEYIFEGLITTLPGEDLYPVFMVSPTGFYMKGFAGMPWIYMTPAN